MLSFFANLFGYLLNWLYLFVQNYGLAIILFSIVLKLAMLPLSIKQQRTMKKTTKIQAKIQEIQKKYKSDPQRMNQETIELYKSEKMSPFSGCLSSIVQLLLFVSIFLLVKSPLTYMKKIDPQIIEQYTNAINEENPESGKSAYPEIAVIEKKGAEDERVSLNMEFLGINLSKVPSQNYTEPMTYIIPVLYVVSSFVSIRITTNMQSGKKKKKEEDGTEERNELDAVAQANKSMTILMPIMSISIALIAPLGLALYWLVSNILMIIERLALNKYFDSKEEKENG